MIEVKEVKKRNKHNYTCELELKALIIMINNSSDLTFNLDEAGKYNNTIRECIKHFKMIDNLQIDGNSKVELRRRLRSRVTRLAEKTVIDQLGYDQFGTIVLLMIKNILTKPQFSGYTYKPDFYSDASYKILKYLHNFDHNLISERTGQAVNAFAYVTQIIHNSILSVINANNKDIEEKSKEYTRQKLVNVINANKVGSSFFNEYSYKTEKCDFYKAFNNTDREQCINEIENFFKGFDCSKYNKIHIQVPSILNFKINDFSELQKLKMNNKNLVLEVGHV